MEPHEFVKKIREAEAAMPFPRLEPEDVRLRRALLYEVLKEFSVDVLGEAIVIISQSGEGFFPKPPELYEACLEVVEGRKPPTVSQKKYSPVVHQCTHSDGNRADPAISELALLFPYEAEHIYCSVDQATCPKCGKLHVAQEPHAITVIASRYPESSQGWNKLWKGMMLCPSCEK